MKVPGPVRKFYDLFPLYTFEQQNHIPSIKDTLFVYSIDTCDPDCLLAEAILTQYNIPFTIKEASRYVTPEEKLPIFYTNKTNLGIKDIIEKFVPKKDADEPVLLAVLEKVKNGYYSLLDQALIDQNYLVSKDQARLWPINITIKKQAALETQTAKGYFNTTPTQLTIALEALDQVIADREEIKLVDLLIYAVCTPIDKIIDLPRCVQRDMLRVTNHLHPPEQELSISYETTPDVVSSEPLSSESEMIIV